MSSLCEVLLPWLQFGAQALPVHLRKGVFRPGKIAKRTFQNRLGSHQIAGRLVMKSHRQLNQSLEMASEAAVWRRLTPDVFQGLMGVEKAAGIEQTKAAPPGIL